MMKVTVTLTRRSLRRKHQPREKVLPKKVKRERKEPRKGSQQVERKARSPSMHHLLRRNQRRRRNQKVILKLKKSRSNKEKVQNKQRSQLSRSLNYLKWVKWSSLLSRSPSQTKKKCKT